MAENKSVPSTSPVESEVALLRPVVRTRASELAPLFVSTIWIFLTLTAYYIIKPIRSRVLQTSIGVDNKWIALIATTVFVGVIAYAYGRIVPKVTRTRLIHATFVIFMLCMGAFAATLPIGGVLNAYVFYVWVSTFNLMIVSQFWSLSADVWSKEEGGRLFGFIGVGGVCGSIFGSAVVAKFAKPLGTTTMLLLSAAVLLVCLLLARYILKFAADRQKIAVDKKPTTPPGDAVRGQNVIGMVWRSPYLRLIAVMMLLLNVINTNNEWILDKMVSHQGKGFNFDEFYATYNLIQNSITLVIQLFLTARIRNRFGARGALFFEPAIGVAGGLLFLMFPLLSVIFWHKIFENASDYSIQSNTKEVLYLPVSTVEKYSAKNFNDTFVVRSGDGLAALSIFTATSLVMPAFGDVGLKWMVAFDIVLGVLWILVANRVGRMNAELMERTPAKAEAA